MVDWYLFKLLFFESDNKKENKDKKDCKDCGKITITIVGKR